MYFVCSMQSAYRDYVNCVGLVDTGYFKKRSMASDMLSSDVINPFIKAQSDDDLEIDSSMDINSVLTDPASVFTDSVSGLWEPTSRSMKHRLANKLLLLIRQLLTSHR